MGSGQNTLQKAIQTVNEKREKYGGDVDTVVINMLATLFPGGLSVERYDDAIFLIRICEKLGRIASEQIDADAKTDAYGDIVGYGLLGLLKDEAGKDSDGS
jgi:hypothetical protein